MLGGNHSARSVKALGKRATIHRILYIFTAINWYESIHIRYPFPHLFFLQNKLKWILFSFFPMHTQDPTNWCREKVSQLLFKLRIIKILNMQNTEIINAIQIVEKEKTVTFSEISFSPATLKEKCYYFSIFFSPRPFSLPCAFSTVFFPSPKRISQVKL